MTVLLAIDTSVACAVGVAQEQQLSCRSSLSARHAAQEVLALVDEVLADAELHLSQLEAIAVVTGPGSFTGLRIGIGAAQGLSAALQLPVIPISSLALQAWSASRNHAYEYWLVAQPARDGEVYFAAYQTSDSGYRLIGTEQVSHPSTLEPVPLMDSSGNEPIDWAAVGDAWSQPGALLNHLAIEPALITSSHESSIEDLCWLGTLLRKSGADSTELILPNYVKEQMDYN